MLVDEKMSRLIGFLLLQSGLSTEQVSVLSSFGGLCDHEAVEACLSLLGKDGITRRNICINAKGLKSSLLSLTAL